MLSMSSHLRMNCKWPRMGKRLSKVAHLLRTGLLFMAKQIHIAILRTLLGIECKHLREIRVASWVTASRHTCWGRRPSPSVCCG